MHWTAAYPGVSNHQRSKRLRIQGAPPGSGTRIFAISDLHVDFPVNMRWVESVDRHCHQQDVLIVAGDVSDDLTRLGYALGKLRERFDRLFFVPGNHELWVRRCGSRDSLEKFQRIMELCRRLDVTTEPQQIVNSGNDDAVWVVPLLSWYVTPGEGADGLYLPKPGESTNLINWADNYFVRWPDTTHDKRPADLFLRLNEPHLSARSYAPAVSFSHFLPRVDLMLRNAHERLRLGPEPPDLHPEFNFSRVAGCTGIDTQLRHIGALVHIYGHQHRNRWRDIDGVLYVSNCLGYPSDPSSEQADRRGLWQVWGDSER